MIEVHVTDHAGGGKTTIEFFHHGKKTEYTGPIQVHLSTEGPPRLLIGGSEMEPPFRVYRNHNLVVWRTPESDKAMGVA